MSTRNWNIVIFFRHFYIFFQNELFYLCCFYSNMATCKPTFILLTVKEILLVHFIITNFRVAHKMLCTPWLRNPLMISRFSCLGRKAALATIFSRFVKVRFRILDIQITILIHGWQHLSSMHLGDSCYTTVAPVKYWVIIS
jgi:hypothetical protein